MGNDKVFEYLSNICQNKEDIDEYQALFFKDIEHFTTHGKNIKLDFLLLFTISIFNQGGANGFLGGPKERIKVLSDPDYGTKDKKRENKLWGRIPRWIKSDTNKTMEEFENSLNNWLESFIDSSKKAREKFEKVEGCFNGVKKFKDFLEKTEEKLLYSYTSFKKAFYEEFGGKYVTQMGEKTFGLFIEQIGFYAKYNDKLKKWLEECKEFPLYGFSERYIKRFLGDVYKYYAKRLYEEGKFKNFHLDSPVSIDILWNAYRKGNTLDKYLEKEKG